MGAVVPSVGSADAVIGGTNDRTEEQASLTYDDGAPAEGWSDSKLDDDDEGGSSVGGNNRPGSASGGGVSAVRAMKAR